MVQVFATPQGSNGMEVTWSYGVEEIPSNVTVYEYAPNGQPIEKQEQLSSQGGVAWFKNLQPNTTYRYTWCGNYPSNSGGADLQNCVPPILQTTQPSSQPAGGDSLPAPTIQSVQVQQGQVAVAWTAPRIYDKYIVYWGLKDGGPSQSEQSNDLPGGGNGVYVAKPTFANQTYTFAVDGCIDGILQSHCSGWGPTYEVQIPSGMGAFAEPVMALTAKVISPAEVVLNWQNAQPYGQIRVRRTLGATGSGAVEWTLAGNRTSFDDNQDGLLPGTQYHYEVTAWAGAYEPSGSGVDVTTSRVPFVFPHHSGNFLQSSFGGWGNYELLVPQGNRIGHYWRNNDDPNYQWHNAPGLSFAGESLGRQFIPGSTPQGVALLQSNIAGDGVHGNFELVVWVRSNIPGVESDSLVFLGYNTATSHWGARTPILADGQPITGVTGTPAFIQSTFGTQGNYELLVPQGNRIGHYWRNNDDPNYQWHNAPGLSFAGESLGRQFIPGSMPQGVALLQSNIAGDGVHGNFELVVWVSQTLGVSESDSLVFLGYNTATSHWGARTPILADGQPIIGVTGTPTFIQSTFGTQGNYELLVPQGNRIGHYWRNNDDPNYQWHNAPGLSFAGESLGRQFIPGSTPQGVALLQSNIAGDGVHGNFELVVWVRSNIPGVESDSLVFLGYNTATSHWGARTPILADGQPITGVTGF